MLYFQYDADIGINRKDNPMGRSVDYLNNAEVIIYFNLEIEEGDDFTWDDTVANLKACIQKKLPSYDEADGWDGRETNIILQNRLCNIGISEYCGLVSLSVAPRNSDNLDTWATFRENFAISHAKSIEKTLQKIVDYCTGSRLIRTGTFSTGTGVFERADNKEGVYENSGRIL